MGQGKFGERRKGMGHGKSIKLPKKITRQRSWLKSQQRKDHRVKKSSHGKFENRMQLEAHRRSLCKLPAWTPPTPYRGV